MLDLALNHEKELTKKYRTVWYDKKYNYYFNGQFRKDIKIQEDNWYVMQFVSLDLNNEIVGYINLSIDRSCNFIDEISLINFTDKISLILIKDLYILIQKSFEEYNFNKINFTVNIGNPIEKSYDKIVLKYGGRIVGIKQQESILPDGTLIDNKIYEIMRNDYLVKKGESK